MFASRQYEEVQPLIEISFTASFTPGAVGNGTTVGSSQACTVGAPGGGSAFPATFNLGDQLEVFPPIGAATNGLVVSAAPTAVAGTCEILFQNATGGSITPVAGVYRIVATRVFAYTI
jgi:hypothetical protein